MTFSPLPGRTVSPAPAGYITQRSDDERLTIHLRHEAADKLIRHVVGDPGSTEIAGILLGRVQRGEQAVVWIESGHALPNPGYRGFEEAARTLSGNGGLSAVGYYRSRPRPGFGIEPDDSKVVASLFCDPEDLILLLRREGPAVRARFFVQDEMREMRPTGVEFLIRSRAASLNGARVHRLATPPDRVSRGHRFAKLWKEWGALVAAVAIAGAAIPLALRTGLSRQSGHSPAAADAHAETAERPIQLRVESDGHNYCVSWNPEATAVATARAAQISIQDGDVPNRIDLLPQEMKAGLYCVPAKSEDVTFRFQTSDGDGHVSAESFRMVTLSSGKTPSSSSGEFRGNASSESHSPSAGHTHTAPGGIRTYTAGYTASYTPPSAIHRVQPKVPAGIRARIDTSVPVDVRVTVDTRGRVVAATPASRTGSALESYVMDRATSAAKEWRFEPARSEGTPVEGTQVIHFIVYR